MDTALEVWVDGPTQVNPELFNLWLQGASEAEAAGRLEAYPRFPRAVTQEASDQYHVFASLERLLQSPPMLFQGVTNDLPSRVRRWLVNKYYEYDESFMREIVGKSLSSRLRKDLDQLAERSGVSLKSCRRQFENLKRILKSIEDQRGKVHSLILSSFLIDDSLSRQYVRMIFLCHNRFVIDKRRLSVLSMEDLMFASQQFMNFWTVAVVSPASGALATDDVELDRGFLLELHQLRSESSSEVLENLRARTRSRLPGGLQAKADVVMRAVIKALLQIGAGLSTKDVQNLFVDLMDKVVLPCKERGLTREDVAALMGALVEAAGESGMASAPCLQRFLRGVGPVAAQWLK